MSIYRSYFSKNNTLISNSYTNTGRNPVVELNFGLNDANPMEIPFNGPQPISGGFTRFIFDLDLNGLNEMISSGVISTGCSKSMTHYLKMTNTSSFQEDLINSKMTNGRRRATSFDLILFRIPKTQGQSGNPQYWDEGVGFDYNQFNLAVSNSQAGASKLSFTDDKSYSERPSNWFKTTTVSDWSQTGLYDNRDQGTVNYSDLIILDTQHFEFGNEDIYLNMTEEINGIIDGTITDVTGWGIAYMPEVENITGLTESYSVGFFSRHTQTFYQPFLETTFDDLIDDNRNNFVKNQTNKLYLYVYENGDTVNLDNPPIVNIFNSNDELVVTNLQSCLTTKGIYEIEIPADFNSYSSPCEFSDVWSNLSLNGENLTSMSNSFILQNSSSRVTIGTNSQTPELFGFDFYGIKQDEKILNTDIRKVGVIIKKAYSTQTLLNNINAYYRIYVKEGTTEVQVQDWTRINRTPNEFYFIFDTRDKIPNQYYVDMKVNISGQKDTYKRELTFQIVNKK